MTKRTVWLGKDGMAVGLNEGDAMVDSEGRFPWEPLGFVTFTFWPKRCRNGKWRWLCFVERHSDGTYTYAHDQSFGG
jgi:hypothetical protein